MNLFIRLYILCLFVCNFLSYETLNSQNFNISNELNILSIFEKIDLIQKDSHHTPFEISESNEKFYHDLAKVNKKVNHIVFGSFRTLKDVIMNTPKKLLTQIDFVRSLPASVALYVLYSAWRTHI